MNSNSKNALVNILLRSSGVLYLIALGIVLVPMYLRYIPVELYGFWLASGNTISWIGDFAPVSAVMQQRTGVSFGSLDFKTIGLYIGSSLIISTILLLCLFLVFIIFYYYIFDWLHVNNSNYKEQLQSALIYAGAGLLFTLFSFGLSGINYGLQLFKAVGFLTLGTNLLCIVLTYLLLPAEGVKAFGWALLARGIVDLTGNSIILFHFVRKNKISVSLSGKVTKQLFADVSFNFFARIGNILSRNSQLFFIARFITPQAAVVFRITKTIPEVSKFFIGVPAEALMPVFSKYLGQNPPFELVKAKIAKMIHLSIWAVGLVIIGFTILNKAFITIWVGEQLYAGDATNFLIILWVAVGLITNNLMYTVFALGDLRKNNLILFVQSVLFVVLMLVFIKPFGIFGIALALLVAELTISMIYYPWSLQSYMHFNKKAIGSFFKELAYVTVTVFVLYFGFKQFDLSIHSWPLFAVWLIVCFVCYFSFLFLISRLFRTQARSLLLYIPGKNKNFNKLN